MKPTYYLAIDIGASSGRHILGHLANGKIVLEEIWRFENRLTERQGHLCWDLNGLYAQILEGMKQCSAYNKVPLSMGIDTWGVDFVLLDDTGGVLGDSVSYRDRRTEGIPEEVARTVPETELYSYTGIQKLVFNTLYQLAAVRKEDPGLLGKARRFLMIPDYFNYLLTGRMKNEYTNATTTGLVNAVSYDWDRALMRKLEIPEKLFLPLSMPGELVGILRDDLCREVGFDCKVVLPATHDTGSAVLAVPAAREDFLFISSGTWSLLGTERWQPDCSESGRIAGFSNEGGYDRRFRYLKNIMGLWMIQSVRREENKRYSFGELAELARQELDFSGRVPVNDPAFLAPDSMIQAVREICGRDGGPQPDTLGKVMACIYHSLSESYAEAVRELESLTGKRYPQLHIVGGGSRDDLLNRLTAEKTGKEVWAGPVECTAAGNILAQMLRAGEFSSVEEARAAVRHSFPVGRAE